MNIQTNPQPVVVIDTHVSLTAAQDIAQGRARLVLSEVAVKRCAEAAKRLAQVIAERRHVYGLTTGFGPLANRLVPAQDGATLQQNLVHHLASGVPPYLGWAEARAMMLARLLSVLQGYSGASQQAIDTLVTVLNSDLAPQIPARGSVGASGDLTPLAHMVLCLQGQGTFLRRQGIAAPADRALERLGLAPLTLARRDGLALVNGTSAMTGQALLTAGDAQRALDWSLTISAALAEVLGGRAEAWSQTFAEVRPHPGQVRVTKRLGALIRDSARLQTDLTADRILPKGEASTEPAPNQDAYTLRCVPQIAGAAQDAIAWHDQVVARELNSATDNPIFPPDSPPLHGGNFMGSHVALASDAVSTALITLAGLAERQIARLTDERLTPDLPPFLAVGPAGLNSGFMGAQVTASALLAELRATGGAMSAQSISTNGANQDVVSMGTTAARLVRERLGLVFHIQAIAALAVAQAMDLRGLDGFSPAAQTFHAWIRRSFPALSEDRPLGPEIAQLAERLPQTPPDRLDEAIA